MLSVHDVVCSNLRQFQNMQFGRKYEQMMLSAQIWGSPIHFISQHAGILKNNWRNIVGSLYGQLFYKYFPILTLVLEA
jgi:hypothetical protein